MKSEAEITFMHDTLNQILFDNLDGIDISEDSKQAMMPCLRTLCWILEHGGGSEFERRMETIQQALSDAGYAIDTGPEAPV